MKKTTMVFLSGFVAMQCIADDAELEASLLERVTFFATELNLTATNTHSTVWTEPLFPPTGIITTNAFKFEKTEGNSTALSPLNFDIYSNDVNIAYGKLFECSSFNLARNAFIMQLVDCNMMPENIAQLYEIQTAGVGDFRIKVKPEISVTTWGFHFVRGGKAISLYPKDGVNVQPIAQTLDGLLKR